MKVKQLIETLKIMPQESIVRVQEGEEGKESNYWVKYVQSNDKGTSGHEEEGEVIIVGDE